MIFADTFRQVIMLSAFGITLETINILEKVLLIWFKLILYRWLPSLVHS